MKDLKENYLAKLIMVITIIFTMLFSTFAPIISLAAEGDETENDDTATDRINFNVSWGNNQDKITCYAAEEVMANFNLDLSGVKTGFNNLKIKVEDSTKPRASIDAKTNNKTNSSVDISKSNSSTLVFKNKLDSGISTSGGIALNFQKDANFQAYDKEIKFILTGDYVDPTTGETQYVQITKTLTANVRTKDEVTTFALDADLIDNATVSKKTSSVGVNAGEWYATSISARIPGVITEKNVTYGKYEYTIARTADKLSNKSLISNEENCNVSISNLPSYMSYDTERNADGSIKVIITVGEDKEEYTADDVFDFSVSYVINVDWKVVEDTSRGSGEATAYSKVTVNAVGDTKGYNVTRSAAGTSMDAKSNRTTDSYSNNIEICYYLGQYISNSTISSSIVTVEEWKNHVEAGECNLTWQTDLLYGDRREENKKEKLYVYSYRENETTNVQYKADDGTNKTFNLENNELKLKQISVSGKDPLWEYVDFYKKGEDEPFFRADASNATYIVPDGETITDYYAVFSYHYGGRDSEPGWMATYTLDVEKLSENLSENEIKNITGITRYQQSFMGGRDETGIMSATYRIYTPSPVQRYSYFEMSSSNMNSAVVNYGVASYGSITLAMYKNTKVLNQSTNLRNQNPKFYVALPSCFDYENIKVSASGNIAVSNKECTDENEEAWYIDDETGYLVINCAGDWYDSNGYANVSITFTKTLNTYSVQANNTIRAYMITDNESYVCKTASNRSLTKNGVTPDTVGTASTTFTIALDDNVKIRNGVIVEGSEIYPSIETDNQFSTYENPIIVKSGEKVEYKTELAANGSRLKDISFICKLPLENNTSITGDTYSLQSVNSLINLDENITVKVSNGGSESSLSSNMYKIYYTASDTCSFDSDWTEHTSGDTNIANAKAIKIVLDENYTLGTSAFLSVYFNMEMPETDGISGQISAVKFTKDNQTEPSILEPSAIYVIRGIPDGTVNIQKLFEGYSTGSAPSGVTLSDIQFKIKNVKTGEVLVIDGQTDSEGKFNADNTGKVTLAGIPRGKYQVIELTEITGYEARDYVTFEIKNGETKNVTVTNYPIICELTLHKIWRLYNFETNRYEQLDKQQGPVTLQVVRQGDSIHFNQTVTTDPTTGTVTLNVPYGTYSVREVSGINGWTMQSTGTAFDVKQSHVDWTISNENKICRLVIEKTVPNVEGSTDSVRGIKFKIEGSAYADSYIDNNGEKQYLEYEKIVTVGEDVEGVTQTISDDEKKVTIDLGTVHAGNYTISEIDTPTIEIDGENVSKYVDLVRSVSLTPYSTNTVTLENVWRRGTLRINKTAEEGVELDKFQFRVHGTSYYGTTVDVTLRTDKNGLAKGNILLGEYTIEEVGTNAFDATYKMKVNGEEITKEDSMDFKIKDSSTVTIDVENKTAYGYIKVVKTLGGVEDKSAAEGIQFELNGLAPSGENIHEVITIGNDGTGMSNAIPAGGEYILSEVESTVPNNYEVADDVEAIDLTKDHTQENPLEIDVENKRGRGNLEISTETNPAGGDVYPITYKVQEISIDESNGSYTRIDGTAKNVDGDLLGDAKLIDLPAGTYIVSQESIPSGWKKDIPQIIDVPMYNTGYANFIIEKDDEIENTEVRVSKTILNPQGTIASADDYSKYKLNSKQSFEVKITNTETNKEYFVFIDNEKEGVLDGIPEGTYTIEEIYKPKYTTKAYNLVEDNVKTKIEANNSKYYFEIGSEEDGKNIVNINIENQIDDTFGFGGQDSKDNLSKTDVETVVPEIITRMSLFVVDEDGNFIDNCTFDIYDSTGNKVTQISPKTKRNVIKGLDAGQYTIKNSAVPNGYLLADDIQFTVYDDAVRVVRFEIQKNIPRGNLTLQTVYTTDDGKTRNVPKSQYKVVDSTTGRLMTFIKKADGSYARSNLPTATDTISLRAGKVTLRGVETGNYEVGLVGITENYGVTKSTDVEIVDIVENETQDITIQTVKRVIVDIQSSNESSYILDSCGALWGWGYNGSYNPIGTGDYKTVSEPTLVIPNGVKKMSIGNYTRAVLMDNGSLFTWGNNTNGTLGAGSTSTTINTPLSNCLNSYIQAKVVDVSVGHRSMLILDENGKLWYSGDVWYCGLGNNKCNELYNANNRNSYITNLICLTDYEDSPFADISVEKVFCGYNNMCAIIDTDGRLWTFSGGNYDDVGFLPITNSSECYEVTCVSLRQGNDIYEAYKNGIKIVDVDQCFAIDELGNVYAYGADYGLPSVATSFTKQGAALEGKKFIKAKAINGSTSTSVPTYALIDEDNNLYFGATNIDEIFEKYSDVKFTNIAINGNELIAVDKKSDLYGFSNNSYVNYGLDGSDSSVKAVTDDSLITFKEFQVSVPNYAAYFKYDMKFQKVVENNYGALALDDDGNLWAWGHGDSYSNYNSIGNASGMVTKPRMVEFNEDIKFRDIEAMSGYYNMYAVDTKGRVWTWGYAYNNMSGIPHVGSSYITKTCISEIQGNPLAEAYANGTEIEEIKCVYYDLMVAKDNHNKIWIWGSGATKVVSDNTTVPICISDMEPVKSAIYDEGNYITKYSYMNNGLLLLDNENNLWYLYNHEITGLSTVENSPLKTEMTDNGVTIVDMENLYSTSYLLDSLGRVWSMYNLGSESVSTMAEGNKIKYINCAENSGTLMAIDSNGHIWTGNNCVAGDYEYIYAVYGDSSYYAIDKDGHMWVWGSNYNGRLGIGVSGSITLSNPTITTSNVRNTSLYGKKFINVNKDGVEDVNGEIYRVYVSNLSFVEQTIRYLTNKGIEVQQEVDNYVIDTEGKLYFKTSNRWTYPTDVEDSDLYNAYYSDKVKIVEIIKQTMDGNTKYFFKDSNGHLWNTNYKKITDFEVQEFVAMSLNNTLVKDADGNYYINGSNTNGLFGNGDLTVTSSEEFVKIKLDDESQISEIIFFDDNIIYVKDQDSRVWAWGQNKWSAVGLAASTEIVSTPYCWEEQFTDIHIQAFSGYTDPCYNATALDVNGHVWTCGYGGSGTWPESLLGKTNATLGMVNNSSQMGTIVKLTVSTDGVYAINEDGKLWVWGNNAYGSLGYATSIWQRYVDYYDKTKYYYTFRYIASPVCVTNAQGVLKDKAIKEVIDICGYRYYYSEHSKFVYQTGNARVLVVTEDGEVYKMGTNGVVNDYARDMYTDRSTSYPEPQLMEIDGNIIDVKYASDKVVLLKTDTGAVYQSSGTSVNGYYTNQRNSYSFYKIDNESYADMTLDEVYADRFKNTSSTVEVQLDTENHAVKYITTYSDGRQNINTYSYPSTIDAVSAYTDSNGSTIYIVDSNGDLWVKGYNTGIGNSTNTFVCVTKKEFLSEPIWNTIRGRWNVIYRKY